MKRFFLSTAPRSRTGLTAGLTGGLTTTLTAALTVALALVNAGAVRAGPGHDHGDEALARAVSVSPRFSAHSELFELTGIVRGDRLALYLDEYTTNAPVLRAAIELELQPATGAAIKLKAAAPEDGAFYVTFSAPLAAGAYALTIVINADSGGKAEQDLLSATLEIPAATDAAGATPAHGAPGAHAHGPGEAGLIALGAALAAILGTVAWRWRRAARGRRTGGCA